MVFSRKGVNIEHRYGKGDDRAFFKMAAMKIIFWLYSFNNLYGMTCTCAFTYISIFERKLGTNIERNDTCSFQETELLL